MSQTRGRSVYVICSVIADDETTLAEWAVIDEKQTRELEIHDDTWSIDFGSFQQQIRTLQVAYAISIDFSKLAWIDPLPLLSILTEAKSFCARTGAALTIDLGETAARDKDAKRRRMRLLKFIGQHGFLESLVPMDRGQVILNKALFSLATRSRLEPLLLEIDRDSTSTQSRCLSAKVLPLSLFSSGTDGDISKIVEVWLQEIANYGINSHFEGELELIDDFCHKTRVLLTETAHNAYRHSPAEGESKDELHFGLYARLNNPRKGGLDGSKKTFAARSRKDRSPTLNQLQTDEHTSFLEIFYVDSGRGMLCDLNAWEENAENGLRKYLRSIERHPNSNVLHSLSQKLFKEPISRFKRDGTTAQTGLQHVGFALSQGEDFVRIYTDGQWSGAVLPWTKVAVGGMMNFKKQYPGHVHCRGTAWHYCLRLGGLLNWREDGRFKDWRQITLEAAERQPVRIDAYSQWHIFDERTANSSGDFLEWSNQSFTTSNSLWLPRAVTKQHVYQWLKSVFKHCIEHYREKHIWMIADISREQASTIASILQSEKMPTADLDIEVRLVTHEWLLRCFSTRSAASGKSFGYDEDLTESTRQDQAANIINLLKTHDTILFWKDMKPEENDGSRKLLPNFDSGQSPFICEEVIWQTSDNAIPEIKLNGYLDLTQALADEQVSMIAMRALRRTWHLHAENAESVAADVLVTNLLPREARLSLQPAGKNDPVKIGVGSVYVTGMTTNRLRRTCLKVIHLLKHEGVVRTGDIKSQDPSPYNFALNWAPFQHTVKPAEGGRRYERIPGTPYIGKGGAKAIPIRRFDRIDSGNEAFSRSFYGQGPQETYEHLRALNVMKLGHWAYGKHHDLITINLGLAVERESLGRGGPIIDWLYKKLKEFKRDGADIVVYPAHSATEKIIHALKKTSPNSDSELNIPRYFIPVHFLSSHAQTAIRIPSPTYDSIRDLIDKEKNGDRDKPVMAVLMDDGCLTGKVQYELEQLIQNAGATTVIHLGLVNRTGLPLYREFFIKYYERTHHYYWRWDVPTLGNVRTCPLCRAIEQARERSRAIYSQEVSNELMAWKEKWQHQPVTSHWWRHGLVPADLPEKRTVTFGKEWAKDDIVPLRYPINHTTTTGLAATFVEIMRTTSYKEPGLKAAEKPWGSKLVPNNRRAWRRAKIELLVTQILLFFDDFDEDELVSRFRILFGVLIDESKNGLDTEFEDTEVERLACLTLLLTSEEQSEALTRSVIEQLGRRGDPLPIHISIILGLLSQRASFSIDSLNELTHAIKDERLRLNAASHLSTAYAHGMERATVSMRRAIQDLVMSLGKNNRDAHTGFLRRKLVGDIKTTPTELRILLSLVEKSLRDIESLTLYGDHPVRFSPTDYADKIREVIESHDKMRKAVDDERKEAATTQKKTAQQIAAAAEERKTDADEKLIAAAAKLLFGEGESLAHEFRNEFLCEVGRVDEVINNCINSDEWKRHILILSANRGEEFRRRWGISGGSSPTLLSIRIMFDRDSLNNKYVVLPPIAKQMIREFLLNVAHSSERYIQDADQYDVICYLSIADDVLSIDIMNLSHHEPPMAEKKPSELIVSQHIIHNPVERHPYGHDRNQVVVTVRLPLIERISKE